jgi:hypothetical protein
MINSSRNGRQINSIQLLRHIGVFSLDNAPFLGPKS